MRLVARFLPDGAGASSHAWVRWAWAWDVIFYGLLVAALVSSLNDGGRQLAMVVLCAAWGSWYWFMVIKHPWWIQRARPMLLYIAVAMALDFALVSIHPAYQMLNFAIFLQIFQLLPMRWAIPASIFMTGFLIFRGITQNPESAPRCCSPAWPRSPSAASSPFG